MSDIKSEDIKPEKIIIDNKDKRCAPSKKFDNYSCISLNFLIKMAKAYNIDSQNPIVLYENMHTLNPDKYKKYLLVRFSEIFSNVCNNQRCWMKQRFMSKLANDDEITNIFRPSGPEGKFEWLNTYNILDVIHQYEKTNKDFLFLGAVPIDFDDLPELGIKNLNIKKLYDKGIRKIGCVYNLDEHYKGGSHWVASFCDLNIGGVYFFDSYGIEPEKRIQKLLRRFANFIDKELKMPAIVKHNKNRNQYKDSECGVYSINFIEQMLTNSFEKVSNNIIDDATINKKRNIYFT